MPTGGTPAPAPPAPPANLTAEPRASFTIWCLLWGLPTTAHPCQGEQHCGSLWMLVQLPALGVGVGTATMPGLIEQKPHLAATRNLSSCHAAGLLLLFPFVPLLASVRSCSPRCLSAVLPTAPSLGSELSEVTNTWTPGLLFIYHCSPRGPRPSLWALWPLCGFVPFFTSPVCFEC